MSQNADRALNALFDAEREATGVAPHADPTYFSVLDRLARGDAAPMDVPQGSSPLTGTGLATTLTAGTAALAVVAGLWGGLLAFDRGADAATVVANDRAPVSAATIAQQPAPDAPLAPVANAVDAPAMAPAAARSNVDSERSTARRAPASARAEDLAEELRLLSAARAAWKAGRTADAIARLDDHARRFPRGLLREDRGALEAVLLCETGKLAQGRVKARRFLAQHPRSTLVDTVRSACP